jgi:hypothetical protein
MILLSTVLTILSALTLAAAILLGGRAHLASAASWRVLVLAVLVVNALLLVAITEFLGAFHRLTFTWTLAAWILVLAAQIRPWLAVGVAIRQARARLAAPNAGDLFLGLVVVLILAGAGLAAMLSAPNTYDSMIYHLSRVAHWAQNGSVAFFPTNSERQLFFPPLAEYAILTLHLLSGGDRLAALVQWISLLGCILGVSLIARMLGADRRGQLLAAAFSATLPMAILQGSSTQNDLMAALWLICFCYFSREFVNSPSLGFGGAAAGALGLALLTKATAYLFLPGLALGFLFLLRRTGLRLIPGIACGLVLTLGIPAAFYARNLQTYGVPIGPPASPPEDTIRPNARLLVSNLLRGASIHATEPTSILRAPERAKSVIERVDQRLGIPEPWPLDAAGWGYTTSRESRAGAPFHLLIVIVAFTVVLARGSRMRDPRWPPWYVAALLLAVVLVAAMLRWNPFMARFHVMGFLLAAPVLGAVSTYLGKDRLWLALAAALTLVSVYPMFWNTQRPFVGVESVFRTTRPQQYYAGWDTDTRDRRLRAIAFLASRNDSIIGIPPNPEYDGIEYPYWALIPSVATGATRICHVGVRNPSGRLDSEERCSASILVPMTATGDVVHVEGKPYHLAWKDGDLGVYVLSSPVP